MYQTPATHILLNKEGIEVNGKEKLVSTGDKHVVVRPKQIVNIVRICKAETELAANSTRVNIREQQTLEEILILLAVIKREASLLQNKLQENTHVIWIDYELLLLKCSELLHFFKLVLLPPVKPR